VILLLVTDHGFNLGYLRCFLVVSDIMTELNGLLVKIALISIGCDLQH